MTTTQPTTPIDDLDMRALMNDTMEKLGVKTTPLAVPAPTPAPDRATQAKPQISRQEQLIGAGIGIVLLIIASILWSRWQAQAPGVPTPVSTPVSLPTAAPTAPPVVMLPAFAAPDGTQLGQIEATRAITPTAHYGADWIQADVAGSGLIWLKASDWPSLAMVGRDLAPQRPAAVAPPADATPVPAPPCLTAGAGTQTVTVCDWRSPDELRVAAAALWAATYGGNIGTVSTPSPQPWDTVKPNSSIDARQARIGNDPNALACQNAQGVASPLCGGLTNAAAQAALDKETR